MILGINGYSGSGKDTLGRLIQEKYPDDNWQIKKFADKLKQISSILTGIPVEKFEEQEFKKNALGREWWTTCDEGWQPMTVRDLLQKVGTECMRNGLHTNTWVNALMSDYKREVDLSTFRYAKDYTDDRAVTETNKTFSPMELYEYHHEVKLPNWIITDVRFTNEAEAIKKKKGIIIRINRPGVKPINNHPSEVGLDDWQFDHIIENSGSISNLNNQLDDILKLVEA